MARALAVALIDTVHVFLAPRQAPLHERSLQPFAGVAVRRTGLNERNDAEQRGRHVMPAFELRIAPLPLTETESRNDAGANTAPTEAPGATATLQAAAPAQAPLQRTSLDPAFGVAFRTSGWPLFHVVVQLAAHRRPGTLAVTEPGPEIVSVRGAWLSSRTNHGESCVSVQPPACP